MKIKLKTLVTLRAFSSWTNFPNFSTYLRNSPGEHGMVSVVGRHVAVCLITVCHTHTRRATRHSMLITAITRRHWGPRGRWRTVVHSRRRRHSPPPIGPRCCSLIGCWGDALSPLVIRRPLLSVTLRDLAVRTADWRIPRIPASLPPRWLRLESFAGIWKFFRGPLPTGVLSKVVKQFVKCFYE